MPPVYVQVAVNLPQASEVFDYHLPPELIGKVKPGSLVTVPFGRITAQGVVTRMVETPQVASTRPVSELVDPDPVVTPAQIRLAKWLAEQTLAPLASCLERMLPPGLSQRVDTVYSLNPAWKDMAQPEEGTLQARIIHLLAERGALRSTQVERALGRVAWRPSMRGMVKRGVVLARRELSETTAHAKSVRTVSLACSAGTAVEALPQAARAGTPALARRQQALRFLMAEPEPVELPWFYAQTGARPGDLEALAKKGLVRMGESETWRDPLSDLEAVPDEPPALTAEQVEVWRAVQAGIESAASGKKVLPYLLHGVTGSGKTEIYLRAVEETLRRGKQAIVLVPEIALTPQTVRRFVARFPGKVGLVHSRLSEGERFDTWRRARSGQISLVVGPRSALGTPFPNLGLVVIDEAHDDSYYQGDKAPFFHAARTAAAYAYLSGAVCLAGSATPDISVMYAAENKKWQLLRLPNRLLAHREAVERQAASLGVDASALVGIEVSPAGQTATLRLPPIEVVDMREELKAGNASIFSRALKQALGDSLAQRQQAILFLNRRGSATYVFCRECGFSLRCPRCDIPLTYHASLNGLTCHTCGYQRKMPSTCPQCGGNKIRQYGTGTERVEQEVQEMFPGARIIRWDAETTRQKGAHELILDSFSAHHADILVGTQMLAKGLDLPLVTLVGVVLADVGLNLPDYHAAERTFQVLTQVSGRAGRSPLGGQVILQTFQPEHYVIQAAAKHDYEAFYRRELAYRRELRYPPFYHLVRLEYHHPEAAKAEEAARGLAAKLDAWIEAQDRRATDIIGPAPCFYARINRLYRWQIVLRGPDPVGLLRGRLDALPGWRVEVDPPSLL